MQLLRVWLTGAPFFFMFHMGTKAPHISLYLPASPLHLPSHAPHGHQGALLRLHPQVLTLTLTLTLVLTLTLTLTLTKAHYFDSTLKFGGAKYRPTGRGFVMIHEQV